MLLAHPRVIWNLTGWPTSASLGVDRGHSSTWPLNFLASNCIELELGLFRIQFLDYLDQIWRPLTTPMCGISTAGLVEGERGEITRVLLRADPSIDVFSSKTHEPNCIVTSSIDKKLQFFKQ